MIERIGQQLGNYRLISLIGRGGFAEVYLGEHVYLKTQAAIKVLKTRLAHEERERFLTEARTIAHLQHDHIVQVLEFGVEGSMPFLVMEYAPHGTLRQCHPRGTPLTLESIVPYVKYIADALQYAHEKKLIHRDIKPENILLGSNNEVLLSDFGVALVVKTRSYQDTQEVVGTITYMAPEQLQGRAQPASDQYALGIVVYEWLSGDRPFHGSFIEIASQHLLTPPPPLRERVPTIQPAVEEVVLTALAKDPQQRFPSVHAFANALKQASVGAQFIAPPANQTPTVIRSSIPRPVSELKTYEVTPPVTGPSGGKVVPTESKDERVSVWRIGKRQVVAAIIGFAITACLSIPAGLIISIPSASLTIGIIGLILFVLVTVTPEFFGAVFGPWVGLLTGVGPWVGFIITSITNYDFHFSFPIEVYWPIQLGIILVGFISGFAMLKKKGRYNIGRTLGFSSLGAVVGSAFAIFINSIEYPYRPGIVNDVLIPASILALGYIILGLILLPILLVVYNRIASRRKPTSTTGNPPAQALPQLQPLPGTPGPEPRRAMSVKVKTLLIVLALLVIGGSSFLYYATFPTPQDIYLKATSGTPVIDDPLSTESFIEWNTIGACTFTGGALHATKLPKDWGGFQGYCISWSTYFSNFAFQVQMTIIRGEAGALLFRYSNSLNYVFSISPDGFYVLDINHSVNGGTFNSNIAKQGQSAAFKTGLNQSNLLTVIADGSNIYLYVNKQYVTNIIDNASPPGSIGVGGVDSQKHAVDVAFRNAQVWILP